MNRTAKSGKGRPTKSVKTARDNVRLNKGPLVGVVMGSDSDWPVMSAAHETLKAFGIAHEVRVVSAHRTPGDMLRYAEEAAGRGLRIIIAGAGGAAHLPGMIASATPLPVIGVPVNITSLDGLDALLSIAQMPKGVPVACVGVDQAANAALLATRMLAAGDMSFSDRLLAGLHQHRSQSQANVKSSQLRLQKKLRTSKIAKVRRQKPATMKHTK